MVGRASLGGCFLLGASPSKDGACSPGRKKEEKKKKKRRMHLKHFNLKYINVYLFANPLMKGQSPVFE